MPSQSLRNQYQLYNNATREQTGDYSGIMDEYRKLLEQGRSRMNNPRAMTQLNPEFVKPESYNYSPTAGYNDAAAKLKDLSETGGYTPEGIADLRSRGVSPIRSIYAGANREMNRQSSLSGGNPVNAGALRSKNAREMSELVSGATQNVNAGIAQNVAANKLQAAPQYAQLTAGESALRNQYGKANVDARNSAQSRNVDIKNDADRFNIDLPFRHRAEGREESNDMFRTLEGMRGLYGTTPAMSALFGSQAQNAYGQASQNRQGSNNNIMAMMRQLMSQRN